MPNRTILPSRDARPRRAIVLIVLGAAFPLVVGVALATPGFNVLSAPVQARGTVSENLIVNSKSGVHLKTKGSTDFVTQQLVFGGGGHTGWHSHPGPVLVTVKRGALRLIYANDANCEGTIYAAGDSFVDRGDEIVHIARNVSATEEFEIWATYLVPGEPNLPFRIDATPAPSNC
jgi:quercetin dioxygenase-like cupin family protein